MARSVSYPCGAQVAFREFECDDGDDAEWEYDALCEEVRATARVTFPSFKAHDGWRGREDRILLRNAYADIGISTYGCITAIWIVEREDGAYYDADARHCRSGRARRWLAQIAPRFDTLFSELTCIARMSNGEAVYERLKAA
jgi:hypothetical protein